MTLILRFIRQAKDRKSTQRTYLHLPSDKMPLVNVRHEDKRRHRSLLQGCGSSGDRLVPFRIALGDDLVPVRIYHQRIISPSLWFQDSCQQWLKQQASSTASRPGCTSSKAKRLACRQGSDTENGTACLARFPRPSQQICLDFSCGMTGKTANEC